MSTVKAILANRIAPGLLDRYLARAGYSGQLSGEPRGPDAPANLFEPVQGNWGAHGRFDAQARGRSIQLWTNRHRVGLGLAALVGGACWWWLSGRGGTGKLG
jgi:hypothetical protein